MDNTTSNNNASSSDERRPPTKRPRISADETVCLDCHDEMLSTSCTNKNSDSTSSAVSTEVWGLVCDFLPYDSLLSVAATSRTMLHEVMPLVTMLHINKSTQLHAGIAKKRYRDIRDIYIYSLIEYTRRDDDEEDLVNEDNERGDIATIDSDTAERAVPFLCHFGKLERVFLGGQRRLSGRVDGFQPNGRTDNKDKEKIKNLIDAFSGAFRAGACKYNTSGILYSRIACI